MNNSTAELKEILISLIKELNPDPANLRKGKVIKTYKSNDKYVCDVEILLNDDRKDERYPILAAVEIPVIIAGSGKGIICPPEEDSLCDIDFYNGDINYPRVSNFRSIKNIPPADIGELIISNGKDSFIKIDKNGTMMINTKEVNVDCETAEIKASKVVVDSSDINLGGLGGIGLVTQDCPCQFTGSPHAKFTTKVKGK